MRLSSSWRALPLYIQWSQGYIGGSQFVHYREVVLFLEGPSPQWSQGHIGAASLSTIERLSSSWGTLPLYTVEPLDRGHTGGSQFVHYREVVLFLQGPSTIYTVEPLDKGHTGAASLSTIERLSSSWRTTSLSKWAFG